MTVVCSYALEAAPFVVGDLLVSAESDSSQLSLPTIGSIDSVFPPQSGFMPVSLAQKVCVIDPGCVIGWSGSLIAARSFVSRLRAIGEVRPITYSALRSEWQAFEAELGGLSLSLTGWVRDGEGVRRVDIGCDRVQAPHLGLVAAIGSGSTAFLETLSGLPDSLQAKERTINPLERGVALGLKITALLLLAELSGGATLTRFFGGGYELVHFANGSFSKLSGVTYLFWEVDNTRPAEVGFALKKAIKVSYLGDVMQLQAATFDGSSNALQVSGEALHLIGPLWAPRSVVESLVIPRPVLSGLNSMFTNHLFVGGVPSDPEVFSRMEYSASGYSPSIRFSESGVGMHVETMEHVARQYLERRTQSEL